MRINSEIPLKMGGSATESIFDPHGAPRVTHEGKTVVESYDESEWS